MQKSICHKSWILVCNNYPCMQQNVAAIIKQTEHQILQNTFDHFIVNEKVY